MKVGESQVMQMTTPFDQYALTKENEGLKIQRNAAMDDVAKIFGQNKAMEATIAQLNAKVIELEEKLSPKAEEVHTEAAE